MSDNSELDDLIRIITNETINSLGDDSYQDELLHDDLYELVLSNIKEKVTFNQCSKSDLDALKQHIFEGRLTDSRMTAFVVTSKITSMFELIKFFKTRPNLDVLDISKNGNKFLITGLSFKDVNDLQAFYEDQINLNTMGIDNLEKMKCLADEKRFTTSRDRKFKETGKKYKITIRVADNVGNRELNSRTSHYQKVMVKTHDLLERQGFEPKLGSSNGVSNAGIVMYSDEIPDMNRLKLFGITKFSLGISEDKMIISDKQFEDMFAHFIEL